MTAITREFVTAWIAERYNSKAERLYTDYIDEADHYIVHYSDGATYEFKQGPKRRGRFTVEIILNGTYKNSADYISDGFTVVPVE